MKKYLLLSIITLCPILCYAQNGTWRISNIEESYGFEMFIKLPSTHIQKSAAEQTLIEKKAGKYKKFNYSVDYSEKIKSKTISPYLDGYYFVLGECFVNDIAYVRFQTHDLSTVFLIPKQFINKEMLYCCFLPKKMNEFFERYHFLEEEAYNKVYRIDEYNDRGKAIKIWKPYHRFGAKTFVKISVKDFDFDKCAVVFNNTYDYHVSFQNPAIPLNDLDKLINGNALLTQKDVDIVMQEESRLLDSVKATYNPQENIKEHYTDYSKIFRNNLVHLVGQEIMLCGYSTQHTRGSVYIVDSVIPYKDILHAEPIQLRITEKNTGVSSILSEKSSELNERWIVLAHLEWLRDSLIGRDFIYQWDESSYGSPIKQIGTNQKMKDVPTKSVWKCIDVRTQLQVGNGIYYSANPIIVFQNEKYGQGYCYASSTFDKEDPVFGYRMTDKLEYDAKTKTDQKAKQERINKLSAKYGKTYAKLIADGKVRIGMTKEMCRESWGEPDDINVSIGSWGRHEQWVYGETYSSYLYFENGKLTAIQN